MDKIWVPLNKPQLSLMNSISDLLAQQEKDFPGLFTTVRGGHTLLLSADFGGQHKKAKYETYSFLLADLIYLWLWEDMRQKVRNTYLLDNRRMSFKKLSDSRRHDALIPFLRAANTIPGLCVILLIDKRIPSLIEKVGFINMSTSEYDGYRHWKPHVFEKLLRIVHFSAMLISCMSAPKQNLLCFFDEDEIAANEERLIELCKIFEHILNHYISHKLGRVRLGTTKSDDGSLSIEDLTAIPDLVAGAFCELAPTLSSVNDSDEEFISKESSISDKAEIIINWFTDEIHTLKKIAICLDINQQNKVVPRCTRFTRFSHAKEFFWHEDFKNIIEKTAHNKANSADAKIRAAD